MNRVGIGGFQLVDVAAGNGQIVEPKVHFGTPEWYHAVLHSAQLAKQLGLEMSIFSCAGWSEAGGPWVTQEMAQKRLVWSETSIVGGQAFSGKLPEPPSNEGPVRDLRVGGSQQAGAPSNTDAPFYRDSAVVAYRTPEAEIPMADLHPTVTSSSGSVNAAALLDSSLNTGVKIPIASVRSHLASIRVFAALHRACTLARRSRPRHPCRPCHGQRRRPALPDHPRHTRPAGLPRRADPDLRLPGSDRPLLPNRVRPGAALSRGDHSRDLRHAAADNPRRTPSHDL